MKRYFVVGRRCPSRSHRSSDDRTAKRPEPVAAAEHEAADGQQDDSHDRDRRAGEAGSLLWAVGALRADNLTDRRAEGGWRPDRAADRCGACSSHKLPEGLLQKVCQVLPFARHAPTREGRATFKLGADKATVSWATALQLSQKQGFKCKHKQSPWDAHVFAPGFLSRMTPFPVASVTSNALRTGSKEAAYQTPKLWTWLKAAILKHTAQQ